jgi:hypothetical protein
MSFRSASGVRIWLSGPRRFGRDCSRLPNQKRRVFTQPGPLLEAPREQRDRSGRFALIRIPSTKSCRKILARTREWLLEHRHWKRREQQHLTVMLRGFYQHFARRLSWIRHETQRQWKQALQRRGQCRRLGWAHLGDRPWFELPFARSLHPTDAFFRPHLAMTPLRFASPSPSSGWTEDFHLQAVVHTRHTTKRPLPTDSGQVLGGARLPGVGGIRRLFCCETGRSFGQDVRHAQRLAKPDDLLIAQLA